MASLKVLVLVALVTVAAGMSSPLHFLQDHHEEHKKPSKRHAMPNQAVYPEKVDHGFVLELHPVFSLFI